MKTTKNYGLFIGEKLLSCREEREMTRKEFCSYLGVSYRNYCNYENGEVIPTVDKLISICNKLEISLSSMIGR